MRCTVPGMEAAPQPRGYTGSSAGLVALHHHLHTMGVALALSPPSVDDIAGMVLDLLDDATALMPELTQVAPDVLAILGGLNQARNVPLLCTELTEAHRLLGHGLRDNDIDPGRPDTSVGDVLRDALGSGDAVGL